MSDYKRTFITTSIPYINAKPHIGFTMELIQADTLARFHRLLGREVFFSTGTDEHGFKIQQAAAEKGITAEQYSETISGYFEQLKDTVNASPDRFIRTSTFPGHKEASEKIWKLAEESGCLYKKSYEGLYCVGCERFYTEKELVEGLCPVHKRPVEKVTEENWFFKLSRFSREIEDLIESGKVRVVPEERKNEILNIVKGGLEDVSISRSKEKLQWGFTVPGDDTQVMYVWFDALTNYISVLGWGNGDESLYKKFWESEESQKIHVIGKDIIRQHAAIWLGMLLAAKLPLPNEIMAHGWINSGGEKMSKSIGNVVAAEMVTEKYGIDATRYYLLSQIPTLADGDFSWDRFHEVYEADLKNGLGNLVNRITNIVEKKLGGKIDAPSGFEAGKHHEHLASLMEKRDIKAYIEEIMKWTRVCDAEVNEKELWADPEKKTDAIYKIIYSLNQIAAYLAPAMPQTAKAILDALGRSDAALSEVSIPSSYENVRKPEKPLFPPIEK